MTSQRSTAARTPAKATKPAATTSSAKQRSIVSFFQKAPPSSPAAPASSPLAKASPTTKQSSCLKETTKANSLPKTTPLSKSKPKPTVAIKQTTPVPDSDVLEPPSSQENLDSTVKVNNAQECAATRADTERQKPSNKMDHGALPSSPTRKVRNSQCKILSRSATDAPEGQKGR